MAAEAVASWAAGKSPRADPCSLSVLSPIPPNRCTLSAKSLQGEQKPLKGQAMGQCHCLQPSSDPSPTPSPARLAS